MESDKHNVEFGLFIVDSDKYVDVPNFSSEDGEQRILCVYL